MKDFDNIAQMMADVGARAKAASKALAIAPAQVKRDAMTAAAAGRPRSTAQAAAALRFSISRWTRRAPVV